MGMAYYTDPDYAGSLAEQLKSLGFSSSAFAIVHLGDGATDSELGVHTGGGVLGVRVYAVEPPSLAAAKQSWLRPAALAW